MALLAHNSPLAVCCDQQAWIEIMAVVLTTLDVIATYTFLSAYLLVVIILYTFIYSKIFELIVKGVFAPLNIKLFVCSNHGPVEVGFEGFNCMVKNIPYSGWEYFASSILPQVLLCCLHHTELVYQKCQSSILKKYKTIQYRIQIKSPLTFALQKKFWKQLNEKKNTLFPRTRNILEFYLYNHTFFFSALKSICIFITQIVHFVIKKTV